jgi:hypothetical protein
VIRIYLAETSTYNSHRQTTASSPTPAATSLSAISRPPSTRPSTSRQPSASSSRTSLPTSSNALIEHDASLTRRDSALVADQGKPDLDLVRELLQGATGRGPNGEKLLTKDDLSKALSKRRSEARAENKQYTESLFHNMFGSANSSTMLTIFGGIVDDLVPMLVEERFAEGWEPRIKSHYGLTMAEFNRTVLPVEIGVHLGKVKSQ